ncbi:MAG TPA: type VI secretion system-associated FHA domain protein TagH [Vicinamibacterales bacterium]|nr:type VI secretion system-associated FHA domain protein TagH [Vicinamibacterales bacterium]
MTLTLELTAASGAKPGDVSQRVFGEEGGSIGRAPNNTWVLTHNKVSGRHANITCRNGVFYIEDVSRNGVCVNSPDNRLVHGRPYALKTGDRIFIEPYEIGVWVEGAAGARSGPQRVVDPFADIDPFAGPASPLSDPILPETPGREVVDPLLLIPGGEAAPKRGTPPPPPSDNFLGQHYQPPAIISPPSPPPAPREGAPAIPAGYNPLAPDDSSDRLAPPRPKPAGAPIAPPGYNPLAADDPFAVPGPGPRTPAAGTPVAPRPVPPRPPAAPSIPTPPPAGAKPPAAATPPPTPVTKPPSPGYTPAAAPPPKDDLLGQLGIEVGGDDPTPPQVPIVTAPPPTPPAARAPESPVTPPVVPPVVSPDPFLDTPPSVVPLRPRPGIDAAPARRRSKDTSDSQSFRAAQGSSDSSPGPRKPATGPPEAVPEARRPPSGEGAADLTALLAGAGVPNGALTAELSRNLGEILRVVVAGLMDVLQSRQKIKEEFGMQQTIFRPSENNPLKFSANVEDALHNLLVKRNPAYLGTVDAFVDAFDDLRDHQLAVLAGMRVAFEAMLAEFDPDQLQQQFDKQMGGGLALTPAKMRYWDLFRARRAEMVRDPEEAFERLFGEEFRRAYEEQFRQLKAQRRQRKDGPAPPPAAS